MNYVLLSFVLFPFLYGLILFLIKDSKLLWSTSLLGAITLFVVSVGLLLQGESLFFEIPLFTHFGIGLETTSLNLLYGVLTCFMWVVSIVACQDYFPKEAPHLSRFYGSLFIVLSGTLGVFFAYDLFTLFVFFEVMSFASYLWVVHTQTTKAVKASHLYLSFGVVGGLSILFGIFSLTQQSLALPISQLETIFQDSKMASAAVPACCFFVIGFGAKAGLFFLHDWGPPSYVEAPAPATALLSSILSKCGVYGMLVVMIKIIPDVYGFSSFILFLSVLSMLVGGFSAYLSGNLKRVLAYSSISQVGFILWGASLTNLLRSHNAIAGFGTVFHMINHTFIKILLFLLAGIIYQNKGTLELDALKGYGRNKKWFQVLWTVAALSLAAVPLGSGYVSKTLLHEAMVEYLHYFSSSWFNNVYEWLFILSGGFTVAYMTKLYVCLFLEAPQEQEEKSDYSSKKTLWTLSVVAIILVVLGLTPNLFFANIGAYVSDFFHLHAVEHVDYFSFTNLKGSLISIGIGMGLYFYQKALLIEKKLSIYSELCHENDNFIMKLYKPMIWILSLVFGVFARFFDILCEVWILILSWGFFKPEQIPETFFHGTELQVKYKPMEFKVTQSLAFSLLTFGLGFIFTIVYLLVVGGTLQ